MLVKVKCSIILPEYNTPLRHGEHVFIEDKSLVKILIGQGVVEPVSEIPYRRIRKKDKNK